MSAPLFAAQGGGAWAGAGCTRGPWDPALMHGGAPGALLARELQRLDPGSSMAVARLTVEFLGGVPVGPVEVVASLARPGARFQLVDARLEAGGRTACLARAVRLRRGSLPGAPVPAGEPLPDPEGCEPLDLGLAGEQETFHPDAVEIRHAGGRLGSGAVAAWLRLRVPVVAGEEPSPLQRAVAAADFANGLSWVLSWDEHVFVNTELTVHLHREPDGEWIGLDARTSISPLGIGLATGVLHDEHGPVGTCAQALFVDRR